MDGFPDGPRVVMGGSNYLLVWTDAASQHSVSGNDVYGQFISPAGALVGSVISRINRLRRSIRSRRGV